MVHMIDCSRKPSTDYIPSLQISLWRVRIGRLHPRISFSAGECSRSTYVAGAIDGAEVVAQLIRTTLRRTSVANLG